jgi:hypothetical protein
MENEKYYKKIRYKVKGEKQEAKDYDFNSSKERKNFNEDLKKEYRSLKRSEKQDVRDYIDKELLDDEEIS